MDSSVHPRIRQCAVLEADAVCDHLHVPADGLSTEQAEKSRTQFGSNAVSSGTADTVGFRLRRAFINPFTVILFLLAVISLVTDVVLASNFSRNATTVIIICCMLLSGTVRFVQELRAKRISDHLSDLTHTEVTVCRDGQWIGLPASALVVGDLVRLSAGDRVPADLRLIQADDLFVSQSIITGESAVLEKTAQALSASAPRLCILPEHGLSGLFGDRRQRSGHRAGRRSGHRFGRYHAGTALAQERLRPRCKLDCLGAHPLYGRTRPHRLCRGRSDQGRLVRRLSVRPVGRSRSDTRNAAHGHQRLSGQGQRRDGRQTDHRQKHQRHAGLWQHGCLMCGQDRHANRRYRTARILSGRSGQRERASAGTRLSEQPVRHRCGKSFGSRNFAIW